MKLLHNIVYDNMLINTIIITKIFIFILIVSLSLIRFKFLIVIKLLII